MMSSAAVGSLQEIAMRFRADKVLEHTYCDVYEEVLGPLRDRDIALLEIGIWHGNSLKMWLEWLPKATVVGIDVVLPELLLPPEKSKRLAMHVCAQDDEERLNAILPNKTFEVLIDDGSHRIEHQLVSIHYLWPKLASGGLYFIEDIQDERYLKYFEMMPGYRYWNLRQNLGRYDDILVCLQKPQ